MSFFKKLFSSDYRQAIAFEGAGRYREAAEKYMLAGERLSVARMHRLIARSENDPYARVHALQRALDLMPIDTEWDEDEEDEDLPLIRRQVERELADALVSLVEQAGLMDRRDRTHLEHAATIYTDQEEHNRAGEVYAKLGFLNRASEAFKKAGNIKRMEEMFRRADRVDVAEAEFDRAYDTYEFAILAGDPLGAIEALERCVELRPHDAGLSARLQVLRDQMPICGRIALGSTRGTWSLVGGQSITIGREEDNEIMLVSAGVSRHHARVLLRGGKPVLEDVSSRHGTFIAEHRLEAPAPLWERGTFRVGKSLMIDYQFRPGGALPAVFSVVGGYLKGQSFVWAQEFVTTGAPPEEPAWLPAGLALGFIRGYWHVIPERTTGNVLVNGASVSAPTLLRLRDELEFGGAILKVE